ncbi:MAG: HYR domain-containing protein [Candidatus Zixiibacteriota bacterium]
MKTTAGIISIILCLVAVLSANPSVHIERFVTTNPSEPITLAITLENQSGFQTGGFDLVIDVDNTFSIESVTAGDILGLCEWEAFTYELLPDSSIHITAMAETANGPYHPDCFLDTSGVLAYITLETNANFTFCEFFPIRWKWYDCGDNAFSSRLGDTLYVSDEVYDYNGHADIPIARDTTFPTIYGAPESCMPLPREIDFYNGGIWVVINDYTPPVIDCQDDTTVYSDPGVCGAVVEFTLNGWDDCGGIELSSSPPSGATFQIGESPVFCLARDALGNVDTCWFTITVIDTQSPQVVCPADTIVASRPGACSAIVQYVADVIDNCPETYAWCNPAPGYNFPIGETTVHCTATDAAGNTDTGSFTVTVVDAEPPTIDCPGDILINNETGLCGGYLSYEPTISDNCSGVSYTMTPASGSYLTIGEHPVQIIAADAAGLADTCSFLAIVVDAERPVITCPDTIRATAAAGECGSLVSFSADAEDNCQGINFIYSPPAGSYFPVGTSPVRAIAVDTYGNADTCMFTVIVADTVAPVITVPDLAYGPADSGQCGAVITFDITAEDNCTATQITAEPPSGSYFEIGETTVVATASDAFGNSVSDSFTVFVYDIQKPIVTCPGETSLLSDSGYYGAFLSFDFDVTDNCDSVYAIAEPPSGSLFLAGVTEVHVIGIDKTNNRDTCSFLVTVTLVDADNDSIPDWDDNCPFDSNHDQNDADGDGIGDVCDWRHGDANGDDSFNIGDAVFLISYIFKGGPAPFPLLAGDANCDGSVNIGDAVYLVDYIFNAGPPPPCP